MSRPKGSERETTEYLAMLSRLIRRAGERVADADEFELYELVALRSTLEDAIRVAVQGQRKRRSWAHIGAALGITRQAAQERYGDKRRDRSSDSAPPMGEPLWDEDAVVPARSDGSAL